MLNEHPKPGWYVLYGYPGHERKLRDNLRKRLGNAGLLDHVVEILLPQHERDAETLTKNGLIKTIYPVLFQGAVFVLVAMTRPVWDVIRLTPGLTGFYGTGNQPLSYPPGDTQDFNKNDEVDPTAGQPITKGRLVRILNGPFRDFCGMVFGIDEQRERLRVMIEFHQRPTPLDLGYNEVEN